MTETTGGEMTCFWAPSATLKELISTLKQLSSDKLAANSTEKIKVYICFSSRSALQKLFHTSSPDGYVYPPDTWTEKLGLPPPTEFPGLELVVKSLFFRPFSVLHSKYLIIDRQKVFLPSCNVSWEEWYECAIGIEGPIVQHVFDFWREVWKPAELIDLSFEKPEDPKSTLDGPIDQHIDQLSGQALRTTLLPHPHDSSLRQALWLLPKQVQATPAATPLNKTLLHLITNAKTEVIILTPNLTSQQAFTAVCLALINGVGVRMITNRRMMVPEQLATAGTLTEQVIDRLIKEYRRGFSGRKLRKQLAELKASAMLPDVKVAENEQLGSLRISYFRQPSSATSAQARAGTAETGLGIASHAAKSHIKLTIVDRKAIVLGSGNMDRASWRTSQELGVLIEDQDEGGRSTGAVARLWRDVERGLEGCLESYFDS
ncbi:hypothetical protein LTR70_007787 [Exophiala xenobiotica]|uniref:PLD phosphodiesterase domain-containing protein n=1 Tax=Lithohypha guttulata TaxID=1690604 RepID=A0ABR0K0X0_9EURO|nr:hypothetical protein LTR24_008609 [Lithohypha guttulata]KAK5313095.1 hypothetical protein LTR70_007787 [Exophiala xenobiotica]